MDPISVISTILNIGLPLLAHKNQPKDPVAEFERLYAMFSAKLKPYLDALQQEAIASGQQVEQDFMSALGATGQDATGVGATGRGLAASLGSSGAVRAQGETSRMALDMAERLLPHVLAQPQGTSRFQDVVAGMGGIRTATGRDPIEELIRGGVDLFTSKSSPQLPAPPGRTPVIQTPPSSRTGGVPR